MFRHIQSDIDDHIPHEIIIFHRLNHPVASTHHFCPVKSHFSHVKASHFHVAQAPAQPSQVPRHCWALPVEAPRASPTVRPKVSLMGKIRGHLDFVGNTWSNSHRGNTEIGWHLLGWYYRGNACFLTQSQASMRSRCMLNLDMKLGRLGFSPEEL